MKIYVASSWREPLQPLVVERLRDAGHEVYDFRNPGPGKHGFSWSEIDEKWDSWNVEQFRKGLEHERAEEAFGYDMRALEWCDACVHVVPGTAGRSSHLELGWAAGAQKLTVVLIKHGQEPELMYKMASKICTTVPEVVDFLGSEMVPATGLGMSLLEKFYLATSMRSGIAYAASTLAHVSQFHSYSKFERIEVTHRVAIAIDLICRNLNQILHIVGGFADGARVDMYNMLEQLEQAQLEIDQPGNLILAPGLTAMVRNGGPEE